MLYRMRLLVRPSRFTTNSALRAVKNQSQFSIAARRAVTPAMTNIVCIMWCSIIAYLLFCTQPCAFSSISTPSRVMSASPISLFTT